MQSTLKSEETVQAADTDIQNNMRLAGQVFEQYGNEIREMIRYRVNNESTTDDIFQNLFLSLAHNPIPSEIENIKGYLCIAVKNDILDESFRTKSYRFRNRKYAELHKEEIKYPNPEESAILSEEIQKLFCIIEKQLMPHEREAIIQRYCYERDIGEAIEAMRINKRSFSHYLCTGLRKIRRYTHKNKEDSTISSCV